MELARILICEYQDLQIIELQEIDGERRFPILIGLAEAEAIRRRFQGIEMKRPLTHELLASVIEAFDAAIESVTICDLAEHTFFASINIRTKDGDLLEIDSRPSDAIALGAANDIPIFVEEHVLDGAQQDL
jgi:bifunctional DNase/RNase